MLARTFGPSLLSQLDLILSIFILISAESRPGGDTLESRSGTTSLLKTLKNVSTAAMSGARNKSSYSMGNALAHKHAHLITLHS